MAEYHIDNGLAGTQQAMSSSYKSLLEGLAATSGLKSHRIYGFNIGPSGAPASADCEYQADISRITVTGTGTATTPNPNDPNEAACSSTWKGNDTVEPTVTATSSVKYIPSNQRGAYGWITNDRSQMPMTKATNGTGMCVRAKSSGYTGTMGASVEFIE